MSEVATIKGKMVAIVDGYYGGEIIKAGREFEYEGPIGRWFQRATGGKPLLPPIDFNKLYSGTTVPPSAPESSGVLRSQLVELSGKLRYAHDHIEELETNNNELLAKTVAQEEELGVLRAQEEELGVLRAQVEALTKPS